MLKNTEKPSDTDFCVFILTHGRPDNVITFDTLRKSGYDGPVFLIIDNEDSKAEAYYRRFGDAVVMFDKKAVADRIDEFDNFEDRRAIIYARNACFDVAERLGYKWFLQLDDDYPSFKYRINDKLEHPKSCPNMKRTLGDAIRATFEFFRGIQAKSVAFSQGGDWFGGRKAFGLPIKRKAMNSFFCSTERRFAFVGRINEDVNTYTWLQSQGNLFFTIPFVQLDQKQTQGSAGGMTDIYLNQGTYIKSFYTVICSPSCVSIELMGETNRRLHHKISWDQAVPMVVAARHRKSTAAPKRETPPPPRRGNVIVEPTPEFLAALERSRIESDVRALELSEPRKTFDQDYWSKRGFGGSREAWDTKNLEPKI